MAPRDLILLIGINLVWGLNFLAVKWAVADLPPLVANAARFFVVLLFLFPFLRLVPGRMKALLTLATVLGFMHFGAVFIGMSLAEDISAVAIATQLSTPFSTLLAIVWLKETVGWRRILGLAMSFSGVLVLGLDPAVLNYLDAVAWIVFSSFLYATGTILMRQLRDVNAFTTQAWIAVSAIVGSFFLSAIMETGQVEAVKNAHWQAWAAVLYAGIFSSIIGHGGVNYLLRRYEVSVLSPYFLLTPFFAIAAGIIVLGESLTWRVLLGGALTLAGVLIVTLRNARRNKALADTIVQTRTSGE